MTTKTRRRVFLSLLMLTLTLPAETILLKALQTPDSKQAVREWASGLDQKALAAAADRIQSYPFQYRREIMRLLSAEDRANVWRNHIAAYVQQHPELDGTAVAVLNAAEKAVTPEAVSVSTPEVRASNHAVASQIIAVLGRDTADYLLYYLGPKDGTFASAEPLSMSLANFVRDKFALLASDPDCDCNTGWGCGGYGMHCADSVACQSYDSWPMCGWMWNDACDGLCASGSS